MRPTLVLQQLLTVVFVAALSPRTVNAQEIKTELIGLAWNGGLFNSGVMFKINPDGADFRTLFNFNSMTGRSPQGSLIQASNGSLYGVAWDGGDPVVSGGTVFKVKADGTGFVVLHAFDGTTGRFPEGPLIEGTDGALYGQTYLGTDRSGGGSGSTIFKINPDGSGFKTIHYFPDPVRHISTVQGSDGMLYGTGSTGAGGLIFRLNPNGSGFEVLLRKDYIIPFGKLVQAASGELYGCVQDYAGLLGDGVFKVNMDGTDFKILKWGFERLGGLVEAFDGNLYGTTVEGGSFGKGTIFRIKTDQDQIAVLHNFDAKAANPGGLISFNSQLYGCTSRGGMNDGGVVFSFNPVRRSYLQIADFNAEGGGGPAPGDFLIVNTVAATGMPRHESRTITFSDVMSRTMTVSFIPGDGSYRLAVIKAGSPPTFTPSNNIAYSGGLGNGQTVVYNGTGSSFNLNGLKPGTEYYLTIFEYNASGNVIKYLISNAPVARQTTRTASEKIFGTATYGGVPLNGTIFSFDPGRANSLFVVNAFKRWQGMNPFGNMIEAKDGFLYGTTSSGPLPSKHGTIFKIDPDGTQHTLLHTFSGDDGSGPNSGLVQASNNLLFGVTNSGGASGAGTIFSIRTDGTAFRVLHAFNRTDGSSPNGPLVQASNGSLYGTTNTGGTNGAGVIYRINVGGAGFRILHHFKKENEGHPCGGLIVGSDGFLYGMANGGSPQFPGSVFKINMDGSDYRVLHEFTSLAQGAPIGTLLQIPDGTLYGMVVGTGTSSEPDGHGNIFKINPDGGGYKVVHPFNGDNGSNPRGKLLYYNDDLYGFTAKGGSDDAGVLFKYSLQTTSYVKLYDLSRSTGTSPSSGSLIVVNAPDPEMNLLVSPKHRAGTVPLSVKVTAKTVPGATTYTIELNTDPSFGATTAIIGTGGREQTFRDLKMQTKYYNRVRTDITPDWGKTQYFWTGNAVDLACVISPANKSMNVSYAPALEVNEIEGASAYTVQLSRDMSFSNVDFERTANTTKMNFAGLDTGTIYYTRVKTNLADIFGPTRFFKTGSPTSLSYVISPANNSLDIGTRPFLKANMVPGATVYTIQLSEQPDFSSVAFEMTSSSNQMQFHGLKYDRKYYNRVRTNLSWGFGIVKSFSVRTAASISYVVSPADGMSDARKDGLVITSNFVPNASRYTIQLSESSTFNVISFQMTSERPRMTFSGLKSATRYYNRVRTDLSATYGSVRSFITMPDAAARKSDFTDMQHMESEKPRLHVYPNPFIDQLFLYIESADEGNAGVRLMDLNGKLLHQSVERTNATITMFPKLHEGVYLLRIQTNHDLWVRKVVRAR